MPSRRPLFAVSCLSMFVFGMVIALLGTLFGLPDMRARLAIDLAQQGQLFSIMFVGLLIATVVAGPTQDRFGGKVVLVGAAATVAVALGLFALARGFASAAASAAVLGVGAGWLNLGANALVSDLYPESRGRMLNLANVFFGVGALFAPLLVSVAFGALSIGGVLAACTAVAAAGALVAAPLTFPPPREQASFSLAEFWRMTRHPGVLLLAVLMFFQMGNEAALSGWTSTYAGAMGWSPRAATVILLGYWVMTIIGRSVSAGLQSRLGNERLVLAAAVLSAAGCAVLLLGARSLPVLALGAWLTALGLSPVVPTTLALAADRHHRFGGTVFSLLFTVGTAGSTSFPLALGGLSKAAGLRLGMVVPLAGTLAVALCALAVLRGRNTVPVTEEGSGSNERRN